MSVVGGGLAGCEAAWQIAKQGVEVELFEMRPLRSTAAHQSDKLAELVCSNSFRSAALDTAVGLLKEEMRCLGSLIINVADRCSVPAGAALAVDREQFAAGVTERLLGCERIRIVRREVTEIPEGGPVVIATGPLTSDALAGALRKLIGVESLYFYDAIAPIVVAESIDMGKAFRASRYDKGGQDYINCPLSREEYYRLVEEILAADKVPLHRFEKSLYFEGCMPIEEMARRGRDTLAFGPLKPVGLTNPRTGERPFAVVQLRQDDRAGRLFNMVGFQTKMTYPEQRRVFRMIPGLERAEFARLGSLHRNTFLDSPRLLEPTLELRARRGVFVAGQLIGVEGYTESAASGIVAGLNAVRSLRGLPLLVFPPTTALGSLLEYVTDRSRGEFQPMNANYGLFAPLEKRLRGRAKKIAMAERALADLQEWLAGVVKEPGLGELGLPSLQAAARSEGGKARGD